MGKVARFINLRGDRRWIYVDEMKLRLRASQPGQDDLYSNQGGRWATVLQSDLSGNTFQEITRLEAANHFIDRGEEPPEEILHFVSTDDISDSSNGAYAGSWNGEPDETPQQLIRTNRGRWFLFFPGETEPRRNSNGTFWFLEV